MATFSHLRQGFLVDQVYFIQHPHEKNVFDIVLTGIF